MADGFLDSRAGLSGKVAAVIGVCAESGTPVVPQGGNTGLVGGQIPVPGRNEIVVSLERLDKVRRITAVF